MLANGLTIGRAIVSIPIVSALLLGNQSLALMLLVLASLTDLIDGWLARQAGGGSSWGAKMDPLADKILVIGPFLWLVKESVLPIWALWLLISRELLITQWRSEKSKGGPATILGKGKTILQFLSLFLLLWPESFGGEVLNQTFLGLGISFFWASLAMAYLSAYSYIKRG